jgi:polysaccharide deacetylase family protein (PEP-CTERM system associated)
MECRIERNLDHILAMLDEAGAKATFFTLGWIAQRYRALVRRVVEEGHELASHGYAHLRADRVPPARFREDIVAAKNLLEDISGAPVSGYRAPCFSISSGNLWAMDEVRAAGYRYSSSIYPIRHDAYGLPDAPRHAFHPFSGSNFTEIPVSAVRFLGVNWPCGGGGYFRLMPLPLSLAGLGRISKGEKRPCVFYFHPWEIDPGQPRISSLPLRSALRHYTNLSGMEKRIALLLRRFSWNRMDRIFAVAEG